VSIINLFRSITDDNYETIHIEENKSIKEALEVDLANAVISINGHKEDENYILKDDDLCTIRLFPDGDGKDWLAGAGGLLAASVLGLGIGATVGALGAGIASATGNSLTAWLGSLGQQQQSDLKSPDTLAKIPQLRGAKNQSNYNSCYARSPLSPVLKADSNSIAFFSEAMYICAFTAK
jgi:hypothetical protein